MARSEIKKQARESLIVKLEIRGSEIKKQPRNSLVTKLKIHVEKLKGTRAIRKKTLQQVASAWNDENSPLLRLPGEIRNKIYSYVIGGHDVVPFYADKTPTSTSMALKASLISGFEKSERRWTDLFVLSYVCKRLNQETKFLPYTLSTFQEGLDIQFGTFLRLLKKEKMSLITTVSFGTKYQPSFANWLCEEDTIRSSLYACTGLKTVISRFTLTAAQRIMVKQYAEKIGANIVLDDDHLADGDDDEWEAVFGNEDEDEDEDTDEDEDEDEDEE